MCEDLGRYWNLSRQTYVWPVHVKMCMHYLIAGKMYIITIIIVRQWLLSIIAVTKVSGITMSKQHSCLGHNCGLIEGWWKNQYKFAHLAVMFITQLVVQCMHLICTDCVFCWAHIYTCQLGLWMDLFLRNGRLNCHCVSTLIHIRPDIAPRWMYAWNHSQTVKGLSNHLSYTTGITMKNPRASVWREDNAL